MIRSFEEFTERQRLSLSDYLVGYNEDDNSNIQISFNDLLDNLNDKILSYELDYIPFTGVAPTENLFILKQGLNTLTYAMTLSSSVTKFTLSFGGNGRSKVTFKINHGSNNAVQLSSFTAGISASKTPLTFLSVNDPLTLQSDFEQFTLNVQLSTENALFLTLASSTSAEPVEFIEEFYVPTEQVGCRDARRTRDNHYTGLLNLVYDTFYRLNTISLTTNQTRLSDIDASLWDNYTKCIRSFIPERERMAEASSFIINSVAYPSHECDDNLYPYASLLLAFKPLQEALQKLINGRNSLSTTCGTSSLSAHFNTYISPHTLASLRLSRARLERIILKQYGALLNSQCRCNKQPTI